MHFVVCIKQVPETTDVKINPQTHTLIREGVASIVNPFDMYAIEQGLRFREKLGGSIEILPDAAIDKGFRVSFIEQHAHHEFTREAIAEALSRFLRPHLSQIVQRVAGEELRNRQPTTEVEV